MTRPNFFIIGAPKCGTTALSEYLRSHPEVYFSTPKEPYFFCRDIVPAHLAAAQTEEEYLGLFQGAQAHHKAIGEGSVSYLYSQEAPGRIRGWQPEARLIAMLRRPVDLVHSLYWQLVYNGIENAPDFETAWQWQAERRRGRRLSRAMSERPALAQYGEIGRLGAQLERLLQVFPRQQVQVILYDDFRQYPARVYGEVLEFLGLAHDGRSEFPRVNARKGVRWPRVQRLVGRLRYSRLAAAAAEAGHKVLRVERFLLLPRLLRLNVSDEQPRSLSESFESELVEFFRDDVRLLSELLKRDLQHWNELPCAIQGPE